MFRLTFIAFAILLLCLYSCKKEESPGYDDGQQVQTTDIDHFCESVDSLRNCRSHSDSVAAFPTDEINLHE